MIAHLPFGTVTLGTVFSGVGSLGIVGLIIRNIGPWRKQTTDAQEVFIATLTSTINAQGLRIDALERAMRAKDRQHFIELRRIEARAAAQRSLDRHKFNNREACLDSLLRILELSPDKAAEAAKLAREQIERQRAAELQEGAEIHKAEILAVASAERELDIGDKKDVL